MDRSVDPHRPILTMHDLVTVEVTGLMEGFYSNLEDGLFELAYRNTDHEYQRYCFELMRELRYRRPLLMSTFTSSLKDAVGQWFSLDDQVRLELEPELESLADSMSRKCIAHFSGLLGGLSRRAAGITGVAHALETLPIGPMQISRHFVSSCRRIEFEPSSILVVRELFLRFVLDRLGSVYGRCNQGLNPEAGEGVIPVLQAFA